MKITGGPAFPGKYKKLVAVNGHDENVYEEIETEGMTLRDYFAAKAMASFMISGTIHGKRISLNTDAEEISRVAYLVADAMLEAREKE
jgi:hypothetical protein